MCALPAQLHSFLHPFPPPERVRTPSPQDLSRLTSRQELKKTDRVPRNRPLAFGPHNQPQRRQLRNQEESRGRDTKPRQARQHEAGPVAGHAQEGGQRGRQRTFRSTRQQTTKGQ